MTEQKTKMTRYGRTNPWIKDVKSPSTFVSLSSRRIIEAMATVCTDPRTWAADGVWGTTAVIEAVQLARRFLMDRPPSHLPVGDRETWWPAVILPYGQAHSIYKTYVDKRNVMRTMIAHGLRANASILDELPEVPLGQRGHVKRQLGRTRKRRVAVPVVVRVRQTVPVTVAVTPTNLKSL